jgi:hypothetical protein
MSVEKNQRSRALAESRLYDVDLAASLTKQELEAAHCWEADDQIAAATGDCVSAGRR